jgi:uncharacterized protein (TIGR02452 family)
VIIAQHVLKSYFRHVSKANTNRLGSAWSAAVKNFDHKNESEIVITKNKIRLILNVAIEYEYKTIILGAFGCGAYHNDPKVIASYFKEIIFNENYINCFDNIIFAILGKNYQIFEDIF